VVVDAPAAVSNPAQTPAPVEVIMEPIVMPEPTEGNELKTEPEAETNAQNAANPGTDIASFHPPERSPFPSASFRTVRNEVWSGLCFELIYDDGQALCEKAKVAICCEDSKVMSHSNCTY